MLKLGFSPCPNDTFLMYGIVIGAINLSFEPEYVIKDVEALNQMAMEGYLDITKVSFGVLPYIEQQYQVLSSGAAMGFGCGPLLVGRQGSSLSMLGNSRIGSPGRYTSARRLLQLYTKAELQFIDTTYDQIIPGILEGRFDLGLLIHEARFTLHQYDLMPLLDLGEWWESTYHLPVPLGGFVVHRALGEKIKAELEKALQASLAFAERNKKDALEFSRLYAREMEFEVMESHIRLYVNDFTKHMGTQGRQALEVFLKEVSRSLP